MEIKEVPDYGFLQGRGQKSYLLQKLWRILKRKGAKLSQQALSALLGQIKRERARYKRSKPELVFKRYKILIGYQYKMQACGNGLRRSDLNGFVGILLILWLWAAQKKA
jgi:hypothetical protein